MLNLLRITSLLDQIKYKDWAFRARVFGEGYLMQVQFIAPDNDVPGSPPAEVTGRKWYLSPHMTDGEVIQTAFLAIKTAEEHEMREHFLFAGQRVFGPHYDIHQLAAFAAGADSFKKRA